MRARSLVSPIGVEWLGNRFRLNFNIQEKADEAGGNYFEFDSIEVPELIKGVIVAALIRLRYTLDDEIALINNYNLDSAAYQVEYDEYQTYRGQCKTLTLQFLDEKVL